MSDDPSNPRIGRQAGAVRLRRGATRPLFPFGGTGLLLALLSSGAALARPMHVLNSTPAAEAVMDGRNAQYVVRFDGPVDHARSRLEILRDGQVIELLHPLLDSATDVLFASAPALKSGRYVLRWTVKSVAGADESAGMIPFSCCR